MSSQSIALNYVSAQGVSAGVAQIHTLIVAGWTGRDRVAMEKHMEELEALGVPRPSSTPVYYRIAASRLTSAPRIEVSGGDSSGEVEFVMLKLQGRLWVGLGSDHTDRKLETVGITLSKQVCEKPFGASVWAWEEVAGHWDQLQLRAYIQENGSKVLYQEGPVTTMRHPLELLEGWAPVSSLEDGTAMFCGTLAAHGGIRPSAFFEMELWDPVLQRSLRHQYEIQQLPIAG